MAVLAANPAACTLLGRDPVDVCGAGLDGPGGLVDDEDPRWGLLRAERNRTGAASGSSVCAGATYGLRISEVTLVVAHRGRVGAILPLRPRDLEGRIAFERKIEELSARLPRSSHGSTT